MKRKESKFKHGRVLNIAAAVCAALVLSIMPISMLVSAARNSTGVVVLTRRANLVSPTGSVNPHGEAEYEVYDSGQRELEIEAEDVNAPNGTILSFFVDGNSVGQASLSDQRARLKLKTEFGQAVPIVNNGSTVQVRNGGTTILTGVFGGGNGTPSPTASPSGSPSPSPSVSPTGSPSPTASPSPSVSPSPSQSPNGGDLFAGLTGSTVNGVLPNGFAQYELHSSRRELEVRVNRINLPAGTSLSVFVGNVLVGQIIVDGNEGRLRLRTDNGQNVPNVIIGSTIAIRNNAATILSGVFSGFASPSPTASPTPNGSPSPSPSVSPSPSPNSSLGKYFEAHLTGSQINPSLSTGANGEFKVFLNDNETQATLTGEFHNLSSAQTGARIETQIGSTNIVHSFGVIGGRNGNFASTTINVTSAQVQQLRAGLWFAVITSVNNPGGEIGGKLLMHSNKADFDGDGSNDLAVFRPATGTWYSQNKQGFSAQVFGSANDMPVSADYDGDGLTDKAIFRNVNGNGIWEINRSSDGGTTSAQFGFATDTPVRGDFDGDGRNDVAVFRSSTGTWYIQKSNNTGFTIVQFGISEDIPMAADMDGDGKHDITVFRPSTGVWYWIKSSNGSVGIVKFGQNEDKPITGDFDGDGRDDITVYRPSTGVWYIWRSVDNSYDIRQFGLNDDVPVAGNYDGDNKTDIAVFRPSTGIWYIWRSSDGTYDFKQFGLNGDIPAIAR